MNANELPAAFIRRMKHQLSDEWEAFADSYRHEKAYGLRRNLLKDAGDFPFSLEPIPWAPEGFYASPAEHPGRHVLHEAGAYYIQEPSAMAVVSLLDPRPGENILDLCAAPGGKSTQIAGRMRGHGLLVSNEIFPKRAQILSENIERLGIANALVTNHDPKDLVSHFPYYFDRIVVDAPCSGEGMFRKDETAIREWSEDNVTICRDRQQWILECADQMLREGGMIVYSTCTFSPDEDEEMIQWFLSGHPDYELISWRNTPLGTTMSTLPDNGGFCDGTLSGTLRLWPHRLRGEGHFMALLHKKGEPVPDVPQPAASARSRKKSKKKGPQPLEEAIGGFEEFARSCLKVPVEQIFPRTNPVYVLHGEELFLLPEPAPSLEGLVTVRPGLHLGTRKKGRFIPAYALAKALAPGQAVSHALTLEEAAHYLHGETVSCPEDCRGWLLLTYANCPLGWGKADRGMAKNHYPKGLRTQGIM